VYPFSNLFTPKVLNFRLFLADESRKASKAASTPSLKIYGIEVQRTPGTATDISDASHLNDNGEKINDKPSDVYDLSGRRVTKPEKGVYIKNGRVTMIRDRGNKKTETSKNQEEQLP
jgi:hypothetical protein